MRPIPNIPRGPRRLKPRSPQLLLAWPRVSPEWELASISALMRPTPWRADKVRHRDGDQAWSVEAHRAVVDAGRVVADRLGVEWTAESPAAGEYFLIADLPPAVEDEARAIGLAMSKADPEAWFVLGKLFIKAGRFYRRRRGYRLELVRAADVHLPRAMRGALRDLL